MQNNQNRPSHFAGRNGRNAKMVEPLGKLIVPVTLNAHLSDDSAILLLGIYPGKWKTSVYTKTYMQIFAVALSIIARNWKQTQIASTDECIKNSGTSMQWKSTQKFKKWIWILTHVGVWFNLIFLNIQQAT